MLASLQNYISLGSGFWVNLTLKGLDYLRACWTQFIIEDSQSLFPSPIFVFLTMWKELELSKAHNYGADYLSLMAAICNFMSQLAIHTSCSVRKQVKQLQYSVVASAEHCLRDSLILHFKLPGKRCVTFVSLGCGLQNHVVSLSIVLNLMFCQKLCF